jgi:hypothetical protein
MSLTVEVAGFGVLHAESGFVLVLLAQQENFQAWTVYRRPAAFSGDLL